jgi:hypothetical protein
MEKWIPILLFIVVPLINRIVEMNKARAEKATAELKRQDRKERRKRRADRQRSKNPTQIQVNIEDESLEEILMKDQPPEFNDELRKEAEALGVELGGGWQTVESPQEEQFQAELSSKELSSKELTSQTGQEQSVPAWTLPEVPEDYALGQSSDDAFHVEPSSGKEAYYSNRLPGPEKSLHSCSKTRRTISRAQLRDHLIWREILGPPHVLRDDL